MKIDRKVHSKLKIDLNEVNINNQRIFKQVNQKMINKSNNFLYPPLSHIIDYSGRANPIVPPCEWKTGARQFTRCRNFDALPMKSTRILGKYGPSSANFLKALLYGFSGKDHI